MAKIRRKDAEHGGSVVVNREWVARSITIHRNAKPSEVAWAFDRANELGIPVEISNENIHRSRPEQE